MNPSQQTVRRAYDDADPASGRDHLAVTRRAPRPTTYFLGRPAYTWREALNGRRRPRRGGPGNGGP